MIGGAAGYDVQTCGDGQGIQFGQQNFSMLFVHTPGETVGDDLGLFEDFLEHEVLVTALAGGLHVPLDGLDVLFDGCERSEGQHFPRMIGNSYDFAVLQEDHVTRVGEKGGNVGRYEMLAYSYTENHGSGHARGKYGFRFVGAEHGYGVGAVGLSQRPGKGFQQCIRMLSAFGYKMGENFRIRFGFEDVSPGEQLLLQFLKVFDDAVMDDGQLAITPDLWVRVSLGRDAVRRPARMTDGVEGDSIGMVGELLFQSGEFALGLDDIQLSALYETDSGGIVTAVFKPPKPLDDDGNCRTVAHIAYNSTHKCAPCSSVEVG